MDWGRQTRPGQTSPVKLFIVRYRWRYASKDQDSLLSDISLGGVTMKVFISQPMIGFSREDVLRRRQEVKLRLFHELGDSEYR